MRYLLALAATPDPDLLARTLDMALSDEVRTQDAPFLVAGVMSNRAGGALAWHGSRNTGSGCGSACRQPDGPHVRGSHGPGGPGRGAGACTPSRASHDLPLAGPRLDQLLERMDINVALAGPLRDRIGTALGARRAPALTPGGRQARLPRSCGPR